MASNGDACGSGNGGAHWYALYTKPHKEQQVHDLLQQRGFSVFLPRLQLFKKGRVVQTKEPLFPCYLFANFNLHETGLYPVQWTQGLRCVVSFCGEPAIVDDTIIDFIKKQASTMLSSEPSRFKPGDYVRITKGPFKDLAAVFDGKLSASGRVRVLLRVLGQDARCDVDEDWLEALT